LIEIKNLTFYYGDEKEPSIKDLNLTVNDGEFVLISGPSGSGKSSLARCLNGLIPHFYGGRIEGLIVVEGLEITKYSTKEIAVKVGMVFQDPENQLVATDVEREIAFGLENLALPRREIVKRVEEALDTVGIAQLRGRSLHELSGGEKQKVAIASVLALKPRVLVLDEPTSELDPQGAEEVLSIVQRLNDELGLTVILVEHRLERVIHLVDRFIVMSAGGIIADGPPDTVLDRSYGNLVKEGIGVPPLIRLIHELRKRGVKVGKIPLTVKEGRKVLDAVFRDARPALPPLPERSYAGPLLKVEDLWFAYNCGEAVLKGVNLSIGVGEFIAVMGRNAAGKSTLVKHFNGLLKPFQGKVTVNGLDTKKHTVAEIARQVGYVFQNPNDHLFADTVEEELLFTLRNLGFGDLYEKAEETLAEFDLIKYRHQYPRFLSGGEKQRVALASVLVTGPRLLILDEPTRGMDHGLKNRLMEFLKVYCEKGNTVIVITHDLELAAEYAERIILLSEGGVVADGNKREVLARALLFSPQINRVFQGFEKYGVAQDVLTVKEAVDLYDQRGAEAGKEADQ
jgi:energy-coupling factor transport system ATP-binding protein